MPRLDLIAGARPNFMKIASMIRALEKQTSHAPLEFRLVHTGQHYDARMSGDFFEQLRIPLPHVNLEAGSGTQAQQTAVIMVRYEELLQAERSDLCVVVGDVTSTMACAIAARKGGLEVAHVEAGIRSGDWSMPEEVNRVVTDAIASLYFTTSETASQNLLRAGAHGEQVHFVGNTMIDTLLANRPLFRPPSFWSELGLQCRHYFLLTLHRPANVDDKAKLHRTLTTIDEASGGLPVVFSIHPRTRQVLGAEHEKYDHIKLVDPQPYLEFNYLVENAAAVITDSGGITEETTVLGIPCLTLRDSTERPETVTMGTNELLGTDGRTIPPAMARVINGQWKTGTIPPLWDGRAGERIVDILGRHLTRR